MIQAQQSEVGFWRLATIFLAILTIPQVFFYPLSSDTAGLQWVALRLVQHGQLPYVGTWEPNFPGTLVFHIPAVLLFGNSEIGFRVIEVLFQFVTLAALFRLSSHWLSPRASFFSCLSFMICTIHSGFLYYGQRDVFAAGLIIIALTLWFESEYRTTLHVVMAGVCLGLATLIRPFYIILAALLLVLYWRRITISRRWLFLIGVALPAFLVLMPYVIAGDLEKAFETTILFLSLYASVPTTSIHDLGHVLLQSFAVLGFAVVALLPVNIRFVNARFPTALIRPFGKKEWHLLLGMLTCVLLIIIGQHRFLMYHFAPLYALSAPLAGVGMERTVLAIGSRSIRRFFIFAFSVALLFFYTPFVKILTKTSWIDLDTRKVSDTFKDFDAIRDDSIIHYLQLPANAVGDVEVCSYDARLRLRLDREPASRFLYFQAFTVTDSHGGHPAFQRAWKKEFLHALVSAPARFVILNGYMGFWGQDAPSKSLPRDFPDLDSLLSANYTRDTVLGWAVIYQIKSFAPSISSGN